MLTSAAALGVAMMVGASMPANAVILNFVDFIDTVGEQAITNTTDFGAGLSNGAGTMLLGGVTVTAFGSNTTVGTVANQSTGPYAYLDGRSGGFGAGIGVCQNITGSNQCNPNGDDNVTGNDPTEILSLSFNQDVQITKAFFRDRDHKTAFPVEVGTGIPLGPAKIDFSVNGGAATAKTFGATTPLGTLLNGVALGILLAEQTIDFGFNNTQFYLSGLEVFGKPGGTIPQVPLPASIYLFGTGLLGIGFLARRRRRKAKGELKFA